MNGYRAYVLHSFTKRRGSLKLAKNFFDSDVSLKKDLIYKECSLKRHVEKSFNPPTVKTKQARTLICS